MTHEVRRTLLLGLVLLLSANLAFAQGIVTGSISGAVQDQQGAVIQGAKVTAREVDTNRVFTTESDATGRFSLRALPVGTYNVTLEAASFSKLNVAGVVVSVAKETSLGAQALGVGTTDVINVESTPPLVESSTTQISTTFSNRQVADLPIGTGFDSLALLVPGVAPAGDNAFGNTNGAAISSNGQRTRSNNFMIDGQSNNDNSVSGPQFFFGNPDAVAEFQVITNYSAEFGRNMGSVVNFVTKNGTNNFHGTLFEFHQNSLLDSLKNEEKNSNFGFCEPGQTTGCTPVGDPARVVDNKFGGTIGGPVVKDKLWFFTGLYWQRTRSAGLTFSSAPQMTPTAAGLATLQAAYPGSVPVAALTTLGPLNIP
ncbi:MAG: carboxypeptidase regulatory-like domain-containing protein, partial [Terriglobales bacterium]